MCVFLWLLSLLIGRASRLSYNTVVGPSCLPVFLPFFSFLLFFFSVTQQALISRRLAHLVPVGQVTASFHAPSIMYVSTYTILLRLLARAHFPVLYDII